MVKLFRHKNKTRFIEINLAPKRKNPVYLIFEQLRTVNTKNVVIGFISLSSFVGIFIERHVSATLIEKKKLNIRTLQLKIARLNGQINELKRQLKKAEESFKNFYIPNLKEKVFFVWYYKYAFSKIWQEVNKFIEITKGWNSLEGIKVYPNPFDRISTSLTFRGLGKISNPIRYKKITQNPFTGTSSILGINNSYTVIVYPFPVDPKFLQSLQKIKDNTIKANLLLQYGLIYRDLYSFNLKIPLTFAFPLNGVCPDKQTCENIFKNLKNYCSVVYINREIREEKFFLNTVQPKTVFEGICLKYTY